MSRPTRLKQRIKPNVLGEMIRLYRTVNRQTIRDLATIIGTSPATMMRIEHGEAFDVATFLKLQRWLLSSAGEPS